MNAVLQNKNYPVLSCEIDQNMVIKIKEVLDKQHLPIVLQDNCTLETVNEWLKTRQIPPKREGLEEARKMYKFEHYKHLQSLSDQYWFKFNNRESWSKINFFTNEYQTETGKIFFEPWSVDKSQLKKETPDLTTNGVLKKRWIIQENNISYLIKAGSRAFNQNPIAEVLTSMFLERLDIIPFVEYKLIVDGLKMCSICRNFIDANTEFVPCSQVYYKTERNKQKESIYEHIVKQSVAYGLNEQEVRNYLDAMITADSIICNTDRHMNNFGYIRDVDSGRLIGFAPLFDSGSAFTNTKPDKAKAKQMFREKEKKAIEKILGKKNLEHFSIEPMLQMINAYPTLTEKEKEMIKNKVTASAEKIKTGGKRKQDMVLTRGDMDDF